MKLWRARPTVIVLLCVALNSSASALGQLPAFPEMLGDAELTDVKFVSATHGWAVGDRGVVWHTADGGRTWNQQSTPVTGRLESICFVDAQHGWAVGGVVHPYTHHTTAIVLATKDGGRKWTQLSSALMPWLKRVHFRDPLNGWVVGAASSSFPAGVFITGDGGKSWTPLIGASSGGWTAGDAIESRSGLVVGYDGHVGMIAGRDLRRPERFQIAQHHLRDVVASAKSSATGKSEPSQKLPACAIGDRGTVLFSNDDGASWTPPAAAIPTAVRSFDFSTIARRGNRIWIAGSPGSMVLHSPDGGASWQVAATGQTLPIRRITFVDDEHGWAVGALGTILATSDGGKSWQVQRAGGKQLAILGLFGESHDIPLELFADLCGNQGYLGRVQILNRRDVELPEWPESPLEDRLQAALVAAGASGATLSSPFPLRQRGLDLSRDATLAVWGQIAGADGQEALEQEITRILRTWRPEVVLLDDYSARDASGQAKWLGPLLLSAIGKAAAGDQFPEQVEEQGLPTWKVNKVIVGREGLGKGTITLASTQVASRLGKVLGDIATSSRSVLRDQFAPPPASWEFHVLADQLSSDISRRDIFGGLPLTTGGPARRAQPTTPVGDAASLLRIAQRQRNVQQLLAHAISQQSSPSWLAQIEDLTRGLDASASGEVLFQLAMRLHQSGKPDLASELLQWMIERYPNHELSPAAMLWQLRTITSGEVAVRLQGRGRLPLRAPADEGDAADNPERSPNTPGNVATPNSTRNGAAQKSRIGTAPKPGFGTQEQVTALLASMQQTHPNLATRPQVRMMVAANDRIAGRLRESENGFRSVLSLEHSSWSRAAETELILLGRSRATIASNLSARRASTKPRLDGHLDDEAWQGVRPTSLRSGLYDDEGWPAEVLITHDDGFIYFAATCVKAKQASYGASDAPRPRDPDLSNNDRVELLIDIDRDYASYYRLTVDHRGWTAESCLGDSTWNPEWYVATNETETAWTVEVAIAKQDLVLAGDQARTVWGLGLQRIVPGVGFQSWTQPSSIEVRPEGFGCLTLE